jgi:hypothetical protein
MSWAALRSRRLDCLWIAGIFIPTATAQQSQTGERATLASSPNALVTRYCIGCHNDKSKTAGPAFNTVSVENVVVPNSGDWVFHR